ncbi:MAG: branched-chain amino acid ABC transporter permease [Beijerinckiaceae bacterium]
MSRSRLVALLVVACAAAVLPFTGHPYLTVHATRILIYAIFAMSLDLLVGYCGLVSLGHAAFFGVAAYSAALLSSAAGITDVLISLPLSVLVATAVATLIGLLTLRTSGIYFIMATLAFAQMLFFLVNDSDLFGGSDGILLLKRFTVGPGWFDASDPATRFLIVLVATVATFVALSYLVRSPFGRALQGIKSNERRMRALGYSVARYKLACFAIGGALAGLAGHLYVLLTSLADPSIIDWIHSAQVLMMVILGGLGTLVGPMVGAFLLIELIDQAAELTEHWKLVVGIVVVVATLFGRGGLAGVVTTLRSSMSPRKPT